MNEVLCSDWGVSSTPFKDKDVVAGVVPQFLSYVVFAVVVLLPSSLHVLFLCLVSVC